MSPPRVWSGLVGELSPEDLLGDAEPRKLAGRVWVSGDYAKDGVLGADVVIV